MLVPRSVFSLARITNSDSRYALNGIRLERDAQSGEPLAVATDGSKLVAVTWPEPADAVPAGLPGNHAPLPGFATIIPAAECEAAAKLAKPRAKALENNPRLGNVIVDEPGTNGAIPIHATDGQQIASMRPLAQEGRYPAWRDIFPAYTRDNSHSIAVDARYLADMLIALADAVGPDESGACPVLLTIAAGENGHARPIIATADRSRSNGRKASGVIMPTYRDKLGHSEPVIVGASRGAAVPQPTSIAAAQPQPLDSAPVESVESVEPVEPADISAGDTSDQTQSARKLRQPRQPRRRQPKEPTSEAVTDVQAADSTDWNRRSPY